MYDDESDLPEDPWIQSILVFAANISVDNNMLP